MNSETPYVELVLTNLALEEDDKKIRFRLNSSLLFMHFFNLKDNSWNQIKYSAIVKRQH